jgi:hypothetical protein
MKYYDSLLNNRKVMMLPEVFVCPGPFFYLTVPFHSIIKALKFLMIYLAAQGVFSQYV